MKELIVSPSILSLDFSRPGERVGHWRTAMRSRHLCDGWPFCAESDLWPGYPSGIPESAPQVDVHIMVEDARTYADVFIDAGADVLTFHSEALEDDLDAILSLCAHIRERGVLAGVSIRPNTPVEPLLDHLAAMDVLLVMSVEPGFGGQSFMEGMLEKVKKARARIEAQGLSTRIEIDGGINAQTGALAVAAGCDTLVAGSYIFRQDIHAGIDSLLCLR
ncbi:MAG: ribulose-phosphate 3-epimerase [Merdibacter sp.]